MILLSEIIFTFFYLLSKDIIFIKIIYFLYLSPSRTLKLQEIWCENEDFRLLSFLLLFILTFRNGVKVTYSFFAGPVLVKCSNVSAHKV